MVGSALPAAAQARLIRPPAGGTVTAPNQPGGVTPAPGDSLAPVPASPEDATYQSRELARLRRRTGTPTRPPVTDRPTRSRSLITADGGFGVTVDTDSPEYLADEDGSEPMFIRVTSEVDGYLTLVSGGTGPALTVLAPNDLVSQLPIRAGQPLDFPLREWLVQGFEIWPQLPAGQDQSAQSLIAVVTQRPIPLPLFDPGLPGGQSDGRQIAVRTFQVWLSRLPPGERGVGQASYVVRRR
jgi:hypothetical protein